MPPQIHIDTHFLIKNIRGLRHIEKNRITWNEFGEAVVIKKALIHPQTSRSIRDKSQFAKPLTTSIWQRAKKLVHAVFILKYPEHDWLRKRLNNLSNPPTPLLLSTISLWLAGAMSITISVTRSMVAAMLYAVGKSSGDWEILVSA